MEDILEISSKYSINKLKTYCSEFLEKNLKASNCLNVIELAEKCHLVDLSKQTLAYIDKHFERIIQYHEIEKKSQADLQHYINRALYFPSELVLRLVTRWVNQHSSREDHFVSLLHNVNWNTLDPGFISRHLDNDVLYLSSQEALLTILHLLDKNNIKLTTRHGEMYRELQERLLPNNELEQELDDSNSFLSIALNSAVMKDLEHSEVDETFSSYILQTDAIGDNSQYGPFRHPSGNDIEAYKAETDTQSSQEIIQFNSNFKKNTIGEDEVRADANKHSGAADHRLHDASNIIPVKAVPDPIYGINHDRGYREARPPYPSESYPQNPNSQYPLHSPASQPETNISFRNPSLDGCDEVYKHYSAPPEINDHYYRQQNYLPKPNQPYQTSDIRCMQYSQDPVVTEASFNQDIFKNDMVIYREEARNANYMCPIFRESPMYPNEIDHYRSMCSSQQNYDNFKLEAVMERPAFNNYKENVVNEIRTPPPVTPELRPEKIERMNSTRSDFDFSEYQILEQVINEQRLCEKSSTATKRYDPKFRALAEASKQTEPEINQHIASQEIFDYKAPESNSTEDKALREDFGNCRISEKTRSKEMMDCEYDEQMKTTSFQQPIIPAVSCSTPNYSRGGDDIMDDCQRQEEPCQTLHGFQSSEDTSFPEPETKETFQDSVLETPPKKVIETPSPIRTKTPGKFVNQQVILTPKEKYAKEISAERKLESIQKNVFPLEETKAEEEKVAAPPSPSPVPPPVVVPETKVVRKVPLALKILRAKKKMAIQKKLILEHGEVRLTHKQKIKLKPLRKRLPKLLFDDPSPLRTENTGTKQTEVKRIVNRKDKLLAEHRSKQIPTQQPNIATQSQAIIIKPKHTEKTINLDDLVIQIELNCPFCDFICVEKKEYFKHIKVGFISFICSYCVFHKKSHKGRFVGKIQQIVFPI